MVDCLWSDAGFGVDRNGGHGNLGGSFFQYHKPLKWFPYLIENQLCQNPGIAKQFEYDSVLLGSSMTINFNTIWFDEYFDLNTIKLTYNAACPLDQDTILEVIEKYHGEVEAVFLGVDITTYSRPVDERAYELQEYLYDNNLLNDVYYWWNKDVLLNYILEPFHTKKEMDDIHTLYNRYYNPQLYNTQSVLGGYSPSKSTGGDLENMTQCMAKGERKLTSENYEEELIKLKKLVEEFDFGIWGL